MDFNNDYILRLIQSTTKFLAKVALNKESKEVEDISFEALSGQDILPILVKRLIYECKYNEAENIIFDELDKNPSEGIYEIAKSFYSSLLAKSDEELEKANFPRDEVYLGLSDLEKIISLNS